MRFYTQQHPFDCGLDLHARSMDVCIVHHAGAILRHRTMQAAPDPFLTAIAPYREGLVVAVARLFTWYWLADLCAPEGMAFVLGHALSIKAMHGGTATNDTSDSHKLAVLLRGGLLPHASVSPAPRRAPRDLLRRRTHLRRPRAALLAQVHNRHRPDNRPEIGTKRASQPNHKAVAAHFADPARPKTLAAALALSTSDDAWLRARDLSLLP